MLQCMAQSIYAMDTDLAVGATETQSLDKMIDVYTKTGYTHETERNTLRRAYGTEK